jgi:predicted RNA methylase
LWQILDEHRLYLSDETRLSAFRRAIEEIVRPGDVVMDLGAGTSILGLLACRAGAKKVYSVDGGGLIGLARELGLANGVQERVVYIRDFSKRVTLPEKVDVVIADQIGRFGFDAGILDYFSDARRRFLKPGGRMIPSGIDLQIAPVEAADMWSQVEFWERSPAGFDFSPARTVAVNTGYPVKYKKGQLLGASTRAASLDLFTVDASPFNVEATIRARKSGMMHGIGGWFEARLSKSVTLTNSPAARRSISRRNMFFPVDRPVKLATGDRVRVRMNIRPAEAAVTWKVDAVGGGRASVDAPPKAQFTHSTLRGMLISKEDLRRTHPGFVPRLSPWGAARRSVLTLCDGGRSLPELEREVYQRHPELFPSPADAALFVSEVVTSNAL